MRLRKDKKVVFTNGIFDLLHPGHIEILKFSKSLGDVLIVGINSDRATKVLKGPERPIHDELHRKIILENISFVDKVMIFDDVRPSNIIAELMPNIVVKGEERGIEEIRKIDKIPDIVEIVTFPIINGSDGTKISTTKTINSVKRI